MTYSYLPPKKISELNLASDVLDNDLFIISTSSGNENKSLSFFTLKNKILSLTSSDNTNITINNSPPLIKDVGDIWLTPLNRELNYWDGLLWQPLIKDYIKHNLENAKNVYIENYINGGVLIWEQSNNRWVKSNSPVMLTSVYDLNQTGVVDNSELLAGNNPNYYLNRLNHTNKLPLSEVSQSSATNNQIIKWNNSSWVPADNRLQDLIDVSISTLPTTPNFVLTWNNTISKFVLNETTDKGHDIEYNGVTLTTRTILNFTGDLVNVTDNSITNKTIVSINLPSDVVRWSQLDSNNNNVVDFAETAQVANSVTWSNITSKPSLVQNLNDLINVDIDPAPVINDTGKALIWDGTKYVLGIPIDQSPGHQILSNNTALIQRTKLNFIGAGVTVTDNSITGSTDINIVTGGGGSTSTASNIGTGLEVYSNTVGVDFRFRTLKAGSGISLNLINSNNEIEIIRNSLSSLDIPDLDTSKITTGVFQLTRIPTIPQTQTSGFGTASTLNVPSTLASNALSTEVVRGDDPRLTDNREPIGAAGGDLTGNYPNPTINLHTVTYDKIQNVTASKFLVRFAVTNGSVQEGTISTGLSLDSSTGDLTVNPAQVNHNLLQNYVINQHIDHSTVSITAGNGLSGGGNLTATRSLTLGTPSTLTASTTNAVTTTSHTHTITGFTPTTRTITAGTGLTGGGDLSANRTLSIASTGVTFGTYTKVTLNTQGQAVDASLLSASDIPNLDTSKLTSGTLPITRGGTGSTTQNFVDLTTDQTVAGIKSFSGGTLSLTNTTSNLLNLSTAGAGVPTNTTRSAGTKILLFNSLTPTTTDFAIGLESGNMWFSVNAAGAGYKWYAGTNTIASLSGAGALTLNTPLSIASGGTGTATQNWIDLTTDQTIAGIKSFNSGQLNLNNTTSNFISWSANGAGIPTNTTRSSGTKLVLFPALGPSVVDFAVGIESGHMWFSTPGSVVNQGYKWYGNTTQIAKLDSVGNFEISNIFSSNGVKLNNSTLSSDTQVLDYYEEGTWTPTIVGLTTAGSFNYSIQTGAYVRIGCVVTVTFTLNIGTTITTQPTGIISLAGLPFTSRNTINTSWVGNCRFRLGNIATGALIRIAANSNSAIISDLTPPSPNVSFSGSLIVNDFITGTLTYFV